jgi:hypothetical protein
MDQQYLRHRGWSHGKAEKLDIHPPSVLCTWRGEEDDNTPVILDIKIPEDFVPEAVVAMPDSPNMILLSDDGTDKCKNADKAQNFFSSLILQAQTWRHASTHRSFGDCSKREEVFSCNHTEVTRRLGTCQRKVAREN